MHKLSLPIVLLAAAPLFAQLPSNTVTIAATRSINLQPDQVVFGLTINSSPTASLDQIVAALSGLGITAADLSAAVNTDPTTMQWNFTLTALLSNLTTTIGSLTKLQQTITQNNSGLMLTFSVGGTQVSQQLQQSQTCSNADLISDATAQAQKLTAAATMTLGPIVKLSNVPISETPVLPETARLGTFAVAEVIPLPVGFSNFLLAAPLPVTCSLLVQFRLLP
jgi:hypothetical protein